MRYCKEQGENASKDGNMNSHPPLTPPQMLSHRSDHKSHSSSSPFFASWIFYIFSRVRSSSKELKKGTKKGVGWLMMPRAIVDIEGR
jgi:hypothetical protein